MLPYAQAVGEPIRAYLRSRPDTARCIMMTLTSDESNGGGGGGEDGGADEAAGGGEGDGSDSHELIREVCVHTFVRHV